MRHTFNLDLSPESNSKEGNTGNTLPSLLSSEDLATFVYDWNLGQKVTANSDYTFYSVHKKGQTLFFESISAHPLFVKVWHWLEFGSETCNFKSFEIKVWKLQGTTIKQ